MIKIGSDHLLSIMNLHHRSYQCFVNIILGSRLSGLFYICNLRKIMCCKGAKEVIMANNPVHLKKCYKYLNTSSNPKEELFI